MTLPDRIDYSDYYQLIKKPIALDMILHRIKSPFYTNLDDFASDFRLMFTNAKTYNEEGSQVYADAQALSDVFESTLETLCPNGNVDITDHDHEVSRKRSRDGESESELHSLKLKLNMGKKVKVDEDDY